MKYNFKHCIGNRLRRLSRIVDKEFRVTLKGFDITESQLSILFALSNLGKVEQGKIGEVLVLERSTVSRNIKLLEKRQIVVKSSDYRPEVELTVKGKELIKAIIPYWENIMDNLIGKIGNDGVQYIDSLEEKLK